MKKLCALVLILSVLLVPMIASADDYCPEIYFNFEDTTFANDFYAFPEVGLQMCVPTDLWPDEIAPTLAERGVVGLFRTNNEEVMSVSLLYSDSPIAREYEAYRDWLLEQEYVVGADLMFINDIPCCVYTNIEYDETSVVILDGLGGIISIDFSPMSHERFNAMVREIIPSIMRYEE